MKNLDESLNKAGFYDKELRITHAKKEFYEIYQTVLRGRIRKDSELEYTIICPVNHLAIITLILEEFPDIQIMDTELERYFDGEISSKMTSVAKKVSIS